MRCRDCAGERLGVGNGLCSRCEGSGLDPDPLQGWPHGDPSCIRCGGKKKCRTCRGRGYFTTLESHGYSNSAGDEITEDEDSGSFSGAPRTQIEDAPTGGDDEPIFRGAQPVRHPFLFYVVWVALSYGGLFLANSMTATRPWEQSFGAVLLMLLIWAICVPGVIVGIPLAVVAYILYRLVVGVLTGR